MEAVINPLWFYLIYLCDTLISFLKIGSFVFFVFKFCTTIMYNEVECEFLESQYEKESKELSIKEHELNKKTHKMFINNILILISCWLLASIIPNSKTVTQMLIASQVTYNRVDKSVETIERVYNDIITRIDKE